MAEYLIFFNDEWVTETTDEGWRQRSRAVRAAVEEMKAAGVFLFTGGLDNEDGPVFHAVPGPDGPLVVDGPYAETKETFGGFAAVDVPDEAAARHWAGRIATACDWPQEVRICQSTPDQRWPDVAAHTTAPRIEGDEYLIFFYDQWVTETDPDGWTRRGHAAWDAVGRTRAAGAYIFAAGLDNEAPVFHVEPGPDGPVFSDGPYAETKELFGGFTAVVARSQEEARQWAGLMATACEWPQEVRVFRKPAQLPTPEADAAAAVREA